MKVNSKKAVKVSKPKPKRRITAAQRRKKELDEIREEFHNVIYNSFNPIMSRTRLSGMLGQQFNGERDLYGTFGYPVTLTYNHYRAMYERMGMATRIVEKFSDDTWGKPPILVDGDARSDGVGDKTTPFLDAWNETVKRLKVWQIMKQADVMCGIGRYSIIFLGTAGDFKQPVAKNSGLFYLNAFDESQARIKSYIKDKRSEMYGMPETYNVQFESMDEFESVQEKPVHYTRTIHISENRLGSRVFGRPRMQEVFNRLMDLEKVTGGGAEAAWLAVYMGFLLLTREGTEMPDEDSEEWRRTEEAIEAFAHRIQRFATLKGVDQVHNLGVHEVKIKDIWSVIMGDLAGSKGVPQRILLGSERGELASSQDMQEWNGVISSRQTNFAEPEMVEPFIKFCINSGTVPAPKSGKWTLVWEPVYTPTQVERAEYALRVAQGANQVTNGAPDLALDVNEWRGMIKLPPRNMEEVIEELARMMGEQQGEDEEDILLGRGNGNNNGTGKKPARPYSKREGTPNLTGDLEQK